MIWKTPASGLVKEGITLIVELEWLLAKKVKIGRAGGIGYKEGDLEGLFFRFYGASNFSSNNGLSV